MEFFKRKKRKNSFEKRTKTCFFSKNRRVGIF